MIPSASAPLDGNFCKGFDAIERPIQYDEPPKKRGGK
jgi:hypothetical protein